MAQVVVSPATLYDMADLGGARSRMAWGVVRDLFARGQFFAFRAGDELVVLSGFIPIGEGVAEMPFNAAPAARRHMPGVLRAGRLTIEAAPYRAIVTYVASPAGAAFVRRLGFVPVGPSEHGEVWAYGRYSDWSLGQGGQPAAAAAAEPDRGGAADEPGATGRPTG